jgi:predicted nucleic acid-binding protein
MPEKHLYDTRFFVEYFFSNDAEFVNKLKQEAKSTKEKLVSVLTIHELHHINMKRSGKEIANLRSHTILTEFKVVDVGYEIATKSAELRTYRKMPLADSVIAATSQICGCVLISDGAHFREIPNLKMKWFS